MSTEFRKAAYKAILSALHSMFGALFFVLLCLPPVFGAGPLEILGISWQEQSALPSRQNRGPRDISALELAPDAVIRGRLVARLALVNSGLAVEGILLRYSLSVEIAPLEGGSAAWTLPFAIDERRVPLVKAGQTSNIPIDATALVQLYVKKIFREGYWPQRLKLQVMVEPRRSQDWPPAISETILTVAALPPHAGR